MAQCVCVFEVVVEACLIQQYVVVVLTAVSLLPLNLTTHTHTHTAALTSLCAHIHSSCCVSSRTHPPAPNTGLWMIISVILTEIMNTHTVWLQWIRRCWRLFLDSAVWVWTHTHTHTRTHAHTHTCTHAHENLRENKCKKPSLIGSCMYNCMQDVQHFCYLK